MSDRTRFWDRNWNLLYDSLSATQTPEEFIREHDWLNCTVDTADGQRWIGRWINNNGDIEKCCEDEYLTQIKAWTNPFMEPAHQFPRQRGLTWVDIVNRMWALEWQAAGMAPIPDDPFDSPWVAIAKRMEQQEPSDEPPRADGRPHPPRPTTTPPMWAHNPNQQRRRR